MAIFLQNQWHIILLVNLFFVPFNLCGQLDSLDKLTNSHIEIKALSNRVIIVKLGANAITAVSTQKGIVVVDAGMSNSLIEKFRQIIEKEFNRDDFACLINSHSHPDHTGGNQVFQDATIIGHENCIAGISGNWKDFERTKSRIREITLQLEQDLQKLEPGTNDWIDILKQKILFEHTLQDFVTNRLVTLPSVTFSDTLNLEMGDVNFQLIYFGKAHSESDILIHIPEEKILMTGDLFSAWGKLHFDNNTGQDTTRWQLARSWTNSKLPEIETIITGHGQILSKQDLELFLKKIVKK